MNIKTTAKAGLVLLCLSTASIAQEKYQTVTDPQLLSLLQKGQCTNRTTSFGMSRLCRNVDGKNRLIITFVELYDPLSEAGVKASAALEAVPQQEIERKCKMLIVGRAESTGKEHHFIDASHNLGSRAFECRAAPLE